MRAKDALGQQGEDLAATFLAQAGLVVIERNWRCKEGEIDIVAADDQALVICEVKTRSGVGFGSPVEAISRQKLRRLRRLAILWIKQTGRIYDDVRIDVVGVLRTGQGEFRIEHLRGVG